MEEFQKEMRELAKIQAAQQLEMSEKLLGVLFTKTRLEKHLTQGQLAKKVKMTQSAISRMENGRSNPRYRTMAKVAKALDKKITLI